MEVITYKKEAENLKYMWNRHSTSFLATYLSKNLCQARSFYTRKIIINYIAQKNPDIDFEREERFIQPLATSFLRSLFWVRINARPLDPFFTKCFHEMFFLSTVMQLLRLERKTRYEVSLLDVGCGAGNYYKIFAESGLNRLLHYQGIDIAEKTIEVCKTLYPSARYHPASFSVGNILNIKFPDRSFDVVMVNSVYEHLSPEALSVALGETIRVAKDLVIINFFNERDIPDHIIVPHLKYFWNCLSRRKIIGILNIHGIKTEHVTIIDRYPPFNRGAKIQYKNPGMNGMPFSYSTMVIKRF